MSVQRWGNPDWPEWNTPDPEGLYVLYADHVAALAELQDAVRPALQEYAQTPRTLTSDDPEPGAGSVVLDAYGTAHQRTSWNDGPWFAVDSMVGITWDELTMHNTLTLIHDGGQA